MTSYRAAERRHLARAEERVLPQAFDPGARRVAEIRRRDRASRPDAVDPRAMERREKRGRARDVLRFGGPPAERRAVDPFLDHEVPLAQDDDRRAAVAKLLEQPPRTRGPIRMLRPAQLDRASVGELHPVGKPLRALKVQPGDRLGDDGFRAESRQQLRGARVAEDVRDRIFRAHVPCVRPHPPIVKRAGSGRWWRSTVQPQAVGVAGQGQVCEGIVRRTNAHHDHFGAARRARRRERERHLDLDRLRAALPQERRHERERPIAASAVAGAGRAVALRVPVAVEPRGMLVAVRAAHASSELAGAEFRHRRLEHLAIQCIEAVVATLRGNDAIRREAHALDVRRRARGPRAARERATVRHVEAQRDAERARLIARRTMVASRIAFRAVQAPTGSTVRIESAHRWSKPFLIAVALAEPDGRAGYQLALAARVAAVARNRVAVVTFFAGVEHAVSARRERRRPDGRRSRRRRR